MLIGPLAQTLRRNGGLVAISALMLVGSLVQLNFGDNEALKAAGGGYVWAWWICVAISIAFALFATAILWKASSIQAESDRSTVEEIKEDVGSLRADFETFRTTLGVGTIERSQTTFGSVRVEDAVIVLPASDGSERVRVLVRVLHQSTPWTFGSSRSWDQNGQPMSLQSLFENEAFLSSLRSWETLVGVGLASNTSESRQRGIARARAANLCAALFLTRGADEGSTRTLGLSLGAYTGARVAPQEPAERRQRSIIIVGAHRNDQTISDEEVIDAVLRQIEIPSVDVRLYAEIAGNSRRLSFIEMSDCR